MGSKCFVTVTRDVGEDCREQILSYKSEQMPINTPVFKDQGAASAVFVPTHWFKNSCNRYYLDIVYKELPYTLWCTAPPTYEVTGSECTVTIGRRGMKGGSVKIMVSRISSQNRCLLPSPYLTFPLRNGVQMYPTAK